MTPPPDSPWPPLRGGRTDRTDKTNNRHYESDEDLGLGFDGGCDAAGGMQTGEGRTDEGCACRKQQDGDGG